MTTLTASPLIEMRGVWRTYRRGPEVVEALRGVDLSVSPGEVVAIVGASGSGKTTLLNIAGGVDRPTAGEVRLMGERIDDRSERTLTLLRRHHVGMVFQESCLAPGLTAEENIRLPLVFSGGSDGERAVELMERMAITARRSFYPHQLSGGEQQRVAIARALINGPRLLLADEPTGNLDSTQAAGIFDLFLSLGAPGGPAVIVATHNTELARRATRVLRLHDGVLASA